MLKDTRYVLLFLVCIITQVALAQDKADSLMKAYDFTAAGKLLRSRLNQARNAGQPTTAIEQHLQQAEMGERMLQATERIVFLDSVVMPAEAVLNKLRLSAHAGRLITPTAFFTEGLPHGFTGQGTMFANDFGDRLLLAQPDSTGLTKICAARLLGGKWTAPEPLAGLETAGDIQDYPFVLPDGQTLYFAAQGEGSLGGYDIYVTRYDADAGRYLKPAHLGFPFNSTGNDYLYCIDEAAGVGYFITDRGQQPGEVCLYAFLPNTTHDIYMLTAENADTIRRAARIASIDELGAASEEATMARRKARKILEETAQQAQKPIPIIIDDTHIYTDASQLHSETAARIATEYVNRTHELNAAEESLDGARKRYAQTRDANLGQQILGLETRTENLRATIQRLAVNMRKAELGNE